MSSITEIWNSLRPGVAEGEGYVRLRIPSVRACAAYAARRIPDGLEAMALEVASSSLPPEAEYPRSTGFEVQPQPLGTGRASKVRLLLKVTDRRFTEIFRSLAEDLISELQTAENEPAAVQAFLARLTSWQEFLRKYGPAGLTDEEQRGLFGELTLLRLLVNTSGSVAAVSAWKGCEGAIHDFQLPGGAIEVKTTLSSTPHTFRVSNVRQLDGTGIPALFLCLLNLQIDQTTGASLPSLIGDLRTLVGVAAASAFERCLRQAGYLDIHEEMYARRRYICHSTRFFHVLSGFPAIIESIVPAGVEKITYSVAVAACSPYECTEEVVMKTVVEGSVYES